MARWQHSVTGLWLDYDILYHVSGLYLPFFMCRRAFSRLTSSSSLSDSSIRSFRRVCNSVKPDRVLNTIQVINIVSGFTLTDRHLPMGKNKIKLTKRKSHTFANLAKPEIPHTIKIYFSYWCMVRDNPYVV